MTSLPRPEQVGYLRGRGPPPRRHHDRRLPFTRATRSPRSTRRLIELVDQLTPEDFTRTTRLHRLGRHRGAQPPAGGTYAHGTGGPHFQLDAVEFCRVLSGRGTGAGLLAQQVPFEELGAAGGEQHVGGKPSYQTGPHTPVQQ